ncbi:hypothetical protein [Streptomyces barkulensis]|uniref:galactose-1-phosphate uridylyltransferase n=1 Tax=Streptomyces barkulensis TaxID=1257026 RepID=UPI00117D376B|nr:hypothetical protein [Streptomyces barkulensis]
MTVRLVRDDLSARSVYVAGDRNNRSQHGAQDCPFCPGGMEAPEQVTGPYAFPNRWPPLEPGRCEIVVHGPGHEVDFSRMDVAGARAVIDVWAERGSDLNQRYAPPSVVVFENRGAEAGATVAHPHSQIFALSTLPPLLQNPPQDCPACRESRAELRVGTVRGWSVSVPEALPAPYTLRLVPQEHRTGLDLLDGRERDGLAQALTRGVRSLDALFGRPMPYQLWVAQTASHHLSLTIAGLLRGPDRMRILGAAELATGLYFSPLAPERAADVLREAFAAEGADG